MDVESVDLGNDDDGDVDGWLIIALADYSTCHVDETFGGLWLNHSDVCV